MATGSKDARSYVKLRSSEITHCYYVQRNRCNTTGRLELRKYDPFVRRHVIYRDGNRCVPTLPSDNFRSRSCPDSSARRGRRCFWSRRSLPHE